ncbi:hypothetical protein PHYBLDRAFT_170258 [Phycomyces blakesleeanus NRRL 1555(-)]|uniref:Uncharacterized protein n=1 Tax=Phycomyces blakesleeanus (strain ATCC 8743b / DSM 1359 / FGSC 10004 / NBRC 33097 / NRRL 1555) TaxID=763407 RepID=A0A162WYP3_PHYB8|nr:hypothetical protein PHYBLDRAFT_170258 [Phycomyces blakesleeanus NRRL 1555(-)]OAD71595.1 hypothetical protein PHYBLDRAFT_170258 [Phycomyces blakesleeanus NRRL 1555(-)]|eukprot:XP_018289635.1 hypothetical protein PHYBLDRAFT_170258 [Phycomyces blakesleeanus NRRL 1555(-)]
MSQKPDICCKSLSVIEKPREGKNSDSTAIRENRQLNPKLNLQLNPQRNSHFFSRSGRASFLAASQYLILETHTKLRAPQMNNGNNTTVNDPSLQRMMDNTSAMYSSNQLVLAQNLDQRPTNTTKAYLAKQEEWRQWCLKKEFGDGELVNDQKLSFFMMDHVMNRGQHYKVGKLSRKVHSSSSSSQP